MKLTLTTDEKFDEVKALFATELERKHERSMVTLENVGGKAIFHVEAKDTAALRAAVNTITSILGMHEKTREAIHGK
jgi:tRNA threonylcarbamoyladenosine modification (KEOPS) complex  Pcc1 subunit